MKQSSKCIKQDDYFNISIKITAYESTENMLAVLIENNGTNNRSN